MEAIADSFNAVKWEERPSKALTVAALGETAVLRDLAVTPLRVEETLEAAFEDTPLGGRELRLWFRIESRSDGPAIIPFPKEVSLFGSLRDELGNEMWSHGFGVRTVEETERTDAIGQGESVAKAVYATFPIVDEAQRFTWDQPFVVSQDGTVETLRVTFDRSAILPRAEAL